MRAARPGGRGPRRPPTRMWKSPGRRMRQLCPGLDLGLGGALVTVARIRPEDVVPEWRGDPVANAGRLEVMDQVVLAHPLPYRGPRDGVVQVVMGQVVPDVPGDEPREERIVEMRAERRLGRGPEQE